jgi:hypothetical protein
MFHACAARFDVTGNLEKNLVWGGLNKALVHPKSKNFLRFFITSNLTVYI